MRTGDSREKIHREFALRPLIFKFLPGPLFLNQFRLLPKARFLLMQLTAGELVRDDHIKVIIFHPSSAKIDPMKNQAARIETRFLHCLFAPMRMVRGPR